MKNGKIFGKINIIDLLVVIALIIAVLGIGIRVFKLSHNVSGGSRAFEICVKVDDVRDYSVQALKRGGSVFSSKDNIYVGEILNVEVEPAKYDLIMLDGERKLIERSDRYSAYVTLRIDGTVFYGNYSDAAENKIGVGSEYDICSRYVSTNGEIISLKNID